MLLPVASGSYCSNGNNQSFCLTLVQGRLGHVSALRKGEQKSLEGQPATSAIVSSTLCAFKSQLSRLGKCTDIGLLCSDKTVQLGVAGKDHYFLGGGVFSSSSNGYSHPQSP